MEDPYDFTHMGVYDWADMRQFDDVNLKTLPPQPKQLSSNVLPPQPPKIDKPNISASNLLQQPGNKSEIATGAEPKHSSAPSLLYRPPEPVVSQSHSNQPSSTNDNEPSWVYEANKELESFHGPGVLVIQKNIQGLYAYFCQKCKIEVNSYKTAENHCIGIKHLKNISMSGSGAWLPNYRTVIKPGALPGKMKELEDMMRETNDRSRTGEAPPPEQKTYRESHYPPAGRGYNEYDNGERSGHSIGWQEENNRYNSRNYDSPSHPPRDRFPPRAQPPPPSISGSSPNTSIPAPPKISIKPSPSQTMLDKLSKCTVETDEDYQLSQVVLSSLLKSLKTFYMSQQDIKCTELLVEAELKVSTVKVLSSIKKQ